jgi:predicted Zn-dependent protease
MTPATWGVWLLLLAGTESLQQPAPLGPEVRRAIEAGRWAEAIPALEAALARSPNAPALRYLLGEGLARRGELEQAAIELRQAVSLRGDRARWWHSLARVEADRGRYQDALAALDRAAALEPSPRVHFDAATCLEAAGELDQARQRLDRVFGQDADHVPALRLAATIERDLGRPEAAAVLARRGLELRPESPRLAALLAGSLLDQDELGFAAEAEQLFTRALAGAPSLPEAHAGLVRARRLRNADVTAVVDAIRALAPEREQLEQLRASVRLVPQDLETRRAFARLALRAGDAAEAARQLQVAAALAAGSDQEGMVASELQHALDLAHRWGD